jgi:hypothetical protein
VIIPPPCDVSGNLGLHPFGDTHAEPNRDKERVKLKEQRIRERRLLNNSNYWTDLLKRSFTVFASQRDAFSFRTTTSSKVKASIDFLGEEKIKPTLLNNLSTMFDVAGMSFIESMSYLITFFFF